MPLHTIHKFITFGRIFVKSCHKKPCWAFVFSGTLLNSWERARTCWTAWRTWRRASGPAGKSRKYLLCVFRTTFFANMVFTAVWIFEKWGYMITFVTAIFENWHYNSPPDTDYIRWFKLRLYNLRFQYFSSFSFQGYVWFCGICLLPTCSSLIFLLRISSNTIWKQTL